MVLCGTVHRKVATTHRLLGQMIIIWGILKSIKEKNQKKNIIIYINNKYIVK
uniref:Uncharacterized protein n=1 Tax=Siphoviridae sp. ctZHD14 TaxID=2827891 RepID=A0A8S5SW24_9CAUD|nr:MAG TPA: hypothetical protein [Siphoviridae sp. ctZHD14]